MIEHSSDNARGRMPANPQGDQGMAWFDGVFRCSPLGVDDCVVWWDAVAAAGGWAGVVVALLAIAVAWVGVVITGASAVFVWRLGVEANRASQLAVSIAQSEATRQENKDSKERILVLLQLNGEVNENLRRVKALRVKISGQAPSLRFVNDYLFRAEIVKDLRDIEFPTADLLVDRLHYLSEKEGPIIARANGMVRSMNREYENGILPPDAQNLILHYRAICFMLDAMDEDLGAICAACQAEIIASGIDDEKVARANAAAFGVASDAASQ